MAKHKHYDAIVAWANGEKIQCRNSVNFPWRDLGSEPLWNPDIQYRAKPVPTIVKYRVALVKSALENFPPFAYVCNKKEDESLIEGMTSFIQWDGDWVTKEVYVE